MSSTTGTTQDVIRQGIAQESFAASKKDKERLKLVKTSLMAIGHPVWPDEDLLRKIKESPADTSIEQIVNNILDAPSSERPTEWTEVSKKKGKDTQAAVSAQQQGAKGGRGKPNGARASGGKPDSRNVQGRTKSTEASSEVSKDSSEVAVEASEPATNGHAKSRGARRNQENGEHQQSRDSRPATSRSSGGNRNNQNTTKPVEKPAPVAPAAPVMTWAKIVSGEPKDAVVVITKEKHTQDNSRNQQSSKSATTQQEQSEKTSETPKQTVSESTPAESEQPVQAPAGRWDRKNRNRNQRKEDNVVEVVSVTTTEEQTPASQDEQVVSAVAVAVEQISIETTNASGELEAPVVVEQAAVVVVTESEPAEKVIMPSAFASNTSATASSRRGFVTSHSVNVKAAPVAAPVANVSTTATSTPAATAPTASSNVPSSVNTTTPPVITSAAPVVTPASSTTAPHTTPVAGHMSSLPPTGGLHSNMMPPHLPMAGMNSPYTMPPFYHPPYEYDYNFMMMAPHHYPYMGMPPVGPRAPQEKPNVGSAPSTNTSTGSLNSAQAGVPTGAPHPMFPPSYMYNMPPSYGFPSSMAPQQAPPTNSNPAPYNMRMGAPNYGRAGNPSYGYEDEHSAPSTRPYDHYGYGAYHPQQGQQQGQPQQQHSHHHHPSGKEQDSKMQHYDNYSAFSYHQQ